MSPRRASFPETLRLISFKLYGSNHMYETERHDEQYSPREQRGSSWGICPFS